MRLQDRRARCAYIEVRIEAGYLLRRLWEELA